MKRYVVVNVTERTSERFATRREAEARYQQLTSLAVAGGNKTGIKQKAYVVTLPEGDSDE